MTLILTCLTNDYIVQVSDRRLSYWDGTKVVVTDNDSNKALFHKNQFVFAYTGLAKLPIRKDGKNIELSAIEWAAQRLYEGKNLEDAAYRLKYRVTELMDSNQIRKLPKPKRRLAFIGAGFDEVERGSKRIRRPLRIVIENFIEDDGAFLDEPRDEFRIHFDSLKSRDATLYIASQKLSEERKIEFTRILKRCVHHKVKPETIAVKLTREIQVMSGKYKNVGDNIMCTFVPQAYGDKIGLRTGGIQLRRPVLNPEPQQLEPAEDIPLEERIVILPPFDSPVYIYVDGKNKTLPYYSPLQVGQGDVNVVPERILDGMSVTVPPFVQILNP
jgi:hypothetical protein